jgi:toxin ParE1/3/4
VREYRLSQRADSDLLQIFIYGLEQFGLGQAEKYQSEFQDVFSLLAENPLLGRAADQIGKGVRRHERGSHIILYDVKTYGVFILALVHKHSVRGLRV